MIPIVKQNLDYAEWEIEALNSIPNVVDATQLSDLSAKIDEENNYINQKIPMLPSFDITTAWDSTAVSTSSLSDVHVYVSKIPDSGSQEVIEYSKKYTSKYKKLQLKYDLVNKVRTLISKITNQNTSERFHRANLAYNAAMTDTGEYTAAANEIRNLLEGVKGYLFKKASKTPGENMTWGKMAERLSKGSPNSIEYHKIIDQENKYKDLKTQLSKILKDTREGARISLEHVWTQVLDHLFIILTLVEI